MEFQKLKFQGRQTTNSTGYELDHIRVAINSTETLTETHVKKPLGTRAADKETLQVNASKNIWATAIGGSLGGILGVIPTAAGRFSVTRTQETASSAEMRKFNSRITQHESRGVAEWGFSIDDENERQGGIVLSEDNLPSVVFEFIAENMPPPPEFFRVEVRSCWSLGSCHNGQPPRWLRQPTQSTSTSKVPAHSVLCQVIVLEIPTCQLSAPSKYMATLNMNSIYDIDVQLPGLVKVIPTIHGDSDFKHSESGECGPTSVIDMH